MECNDTTRPVLQKHTRGHQTVPVRITSSRPEPHNNSIIPIMDIIPPFRLLDLPAELRIMIYEFTFGDNAPKGLDLLNIQEHYPSYTLLQTSQQIYSEAHQTYKAATQNFFQDKTFYISITPACTKQAHMKSLCRRLSHHRFKTQPTVHLRFPGLKGYEPGQFAQVDVRLAPRKSCYPLIASMCNSSEENRHKTPIQIFTIANEFVRILRERLRWMQVGDGLEFRVVMVYLGAIFETHEEIGRMWE